MSNTHKGFMKRIVQGACLAATLTAAPAVMAQTADDHYRAGAERIEIGDRVRMYSQRITAMACMAEAGINAAENQAAIMEAIAEVDGLLDAMKDGDAALNVALAEDDRRMLSAIRGVALQWDTFKQAMTLRFDVGATEVGPDYISRQNLNLMHASKNLISETISHYAIPPALLQNDAFTLQIATRQRTLSQQIAKETCGIVTGNAVMGSEVRLAKSTRRFDASLNALVNGFEGAGVSAPATPEIRDGLAAMTADWSALRDQLNSIDGTTDLNTVSEVYDDLDSLLAQFDTIVPLYIAESKSGL